MVIALLIEAALRSLVLGMLVWLAVVVLRPRNPHLLKTVWLTVLLACLAMPFAVQWRMAPSVAAPEFLLTLTADEGAAPAQVASGGWSSSIFAMQAASVLYAAVAIALLTRFAFGLVSMARVRRASVPFARTPGGDFDVRISLRVPSPATFGSTVLLPQGAIEWTQAKLDAVLSHECSHVRHKDCYVQWLARVHACIFWFNPFAWWLQGRLADLAETTSDDAVIESAADRTAYAGLLLEIAQSPPANKVLMSAARSNITARIERIISNVPPESPPRRWVRGVVAALLIPLFTLAAANVQKPDAIASDEDPAAPKVVFDGDLAKLEEYYPARAKIAGKETTVVVGVKLDREGNVLDAFVAPSNEVDSQWGFEEAAVRVARTLRFSNPRGVATQSHVRVKFELKKNAPQILVPVPDASWTTTFP
jgi:TonB family protein